MPEQEFLPPRRPAGSDGPDVPPGYQDEDPPPWAGLPSVVPSVRPSRPAPGYPMGSWQTAGPPSSGPPLAGPPPSGPPLTGPPPSGPPLTGPPPPRPPLGGPL
ncbi:MAG TPA: hypothetical protein VGS06_24020, partial [Streptosporangiaceae bacterium]|nr:hypothetical protein [Streptosporangiaceae bacterium]